jgi:2'-5' RNA ligase
MKSKDKAQLSLFDFPAYDKQKSTENWQYLVVVTPSQEVKESILMLREKFRKSINLKPYNLKYSPHIALIAFQKSEKVEMNFWNSLEIKISNFPKFVVKFDGLGNQLHGQRSRTLYLKIDTQQPFKELHKLLSLSLTISPRNIFPHLIIENSISKDSLNTMQEFINNEIFEKKFKCTNIAILERLLDSDGVSGYKIIRNIPLKEV